jgi:retinol-binding protein 3
MAMTMIETILARHAGLAHVTLVAALAFTIATATGASAAGDRANGEVAIIAAAQLDANYVFPDRATEAAALLRQNARAGAYDELEGDALAKRLTGDLASVLHDKHVRVFYFGQPDAPRPAIPPQPPDRDMTYGLAKVEHLSGNVGYIDLRGFVRASPDSARVLDAAMDAVASSDALILDLRRNGGGDPRSVARVLSHLLPPNTHLNDFIGKDGSVQSSESTVALPAPPIGAPVYVLTSPQTFSGGEECAYDLQALKRGTLIGAVTGGGANPGGIVRIDAHFEIFVPDARPRNAVTMTNWEGTGVTPDIAVPPDEALASAYRMALDARLRDATLAPELRTAVTALRARLGTAPDAQILSDFGQSVTVVSWPKEVPVAPEVLAQYAGVYQMSPGINFVITVRDGHIWSKLGDQPEVQNFAESDARFFSKVVNGEIGFFRDPVTHAITHLTLYQNGRESDCPRIAGSTVDPA